MNKNRKPQPFLANNFFIIVISNGGYFDFCTMNLLSMAWDSSLSIATNSLAAHFIWHRCVHNSTPHGVTNHWLSRQLNTEECKRNMWDGFKSFRDSVNRNDFSFHFPSRLHNFWNCRISYEIRSKAPELSLWEIDYHWQRSRSKAQSAEKEKRPITIWKWKRHLRS